MKELKLKVIYLPIGEVTPYKNNAKLHPQEQIDQIKSSIREFGMNDPIAVWGDDNLIIEGHGRLIACKQLGFKEIPVIRLDGLTEEQRRAYTLAHNQLTMNTGFDSEILKLELEDINIDMSEFGFDLDFSETEDIPDDLEKEMEEAEKFIVKVTFDTYEDWLEKEADFRKLVENSNASMVVGSV